MHQADPAKPTAEQGIAGTEAYCSLDQWDVFLYCPGIEFALADVGICANAIAIDSNHHLVFGNSLLEPILHPQDVAARGMCERAARRCRQGLRDQAFGACNIGSCGIRYLIGDAGGEHDRQQALGLYRLRIERQCALDPADRLSAAVARLRLRHCGASTENVVQRVGMRTRSRGLGADQL
jgi:hypothetical protein